MKISIEQIQVGPRQRIDMGDIAELAESLKTLGQIQPIGISHGKLVWGMRRYLAAKAAGWTEIDAIVRDDLTPEMEQEIELEEDLRRKDRTWQEKCIAMASLQRIKAAKAAQAGESWTVRMMAEYSNFSKSTIAYMLQVADALNRSPKDEEVWACTGHMDAVKVLVQRATDAATQELERRRVKQSQASVLEEIEAGTETKEAEAFWVQNENASPVQEMAKTEEKKTRIYICGTNMAFEDAVPGEHYLLEQFHSAISHDFFSRELIMRALRKDGIGIAFYSDPSFVEDSDEKPIIWNKVHVPASYAGPFAFNYGTGYLINRMPFMEKDFPAPGVISCPPNEDGSLPAGLVEVTLRAICPEGVAVLCPCNAPVVEVAMTGRTPVWFEADKAKFEAKCAALKNWYEENIPNVEVLLR